VRPPKRSWWSAAEQGIFSGGSKERAAPGTSAQPPPSAGVVPNAGDGSPPPETPLNQRQKQTLVEEAESRKTEAEGLLASMRQPVEDTARAGHKAMQQQIQHLSEQVMLLKEALGKKTADLTVVPQPATRPVAAKMVEDAPRVSSGGDSTHMQPSLAEAPKERTTSYVGPDGSSALNHARHCYRTSTQELVAVANELHASMSDRGASILALIHRRLTIIGRDALEHPDPKVIEKLMAYRRWRFLNAAMRDSRDLKRVKKMYRDSALALVGTVRSLEEMTSQTAVDLAVVIRDRLAVIIQEATLENDVAMIKALLSTKMFRWQWSGEVSTLVPAQLVRKVSDKIPLKTHLDRRKASKVVSPEMRAKKEPASHHAPAGNPTQEKKIGDASVPQRAQAVDAVKDTPVFAKKPYVETEPKTQAKDNEQEALRQIHAQSPSMKLPNSAPNSTPSTDLGREALDVSTKSSSSKPTKTPRTSFANADSTPSKPVSIQSTGGNNQSLFEELFPEAVVSPPVRPAEEKQSVQKLSLPEPDNRIRLKPTNLPKTPKDQIVQSFVKRGETITALQLEHCSTELTEFDFRRLVAKGKHIETWNSDHAFYKVIPGRDPLSLERLPFYYLLFRSSEAAHAYQKNAGRLHKLTALHQPSNIFSAIPPPKGFLEDGEDIEALTSSYLLRPTGHSFSLRMVMQPYHPALSALFKQGGYVPIVPNTDDRRNRIHKVLMHIEGYEPSLSDLFRILRTDAYNKSMSLTLRNESSSSIHRLRDLINLKTNLSPLAATNPRAYDNKELSNKSSNMKLEFEDPNIAYLMKSDGSGEGENPQEINQIVMNRVYNRWILDFDDEDEAKRFVVAWHRRPLPDLVSGGLTWREHEETRTCNCELLW
jgi:hypothetical protein